MSEQKYLTEIPSSLKQLARLVARGFYTIEDALIIDMLVRNPCMKEDDICELLRFDRKQLRARITILKNDKFLQGRLKMETGPDGKAAKVTYYFINYKTFVNVVKYKLHMMRSRMERTAQEKTERASFKCVSCHKTFTDLEADQLMDRMTGEWRCTFCGNLVEEDESALPQQDSRLMVAKFNEQLEPLYELLRAVENIKLAPECLEPEPVDIDTIRGTNKLLKGQANNGNEQWSGEATRNQGFVVEEARVDVSIGDANPTEATKTKERPIWMTESTIVGAENSNDAADLLKANQSSSGSASKNRKETDDTLSILLQNEKQANKSNTADAAVRSLATSANNSDSSDDEQIENADIPDVDVMDSDSDDAEDVPTVFVAGKPYPIDKVVGNEEIIAQMTHQEKETYIQVYQEHYSHLFD